VCVIVDSVSPPEGDAWAAFAANGKPSIPEISWEPSDPETNKTCSGTTIAEW